MKTPKGVHKCGGSLHEGRFGPQQGFDAKVATSAALGKEKIFAKQHTQKTLPIQRFRDM